MEKTEKSQQFKSAKSYIIRVWETRDLINNENEEENPMIRLEDPRSGKTYLFRGYHELISFIQNQIEKNR